MLSVAAGLYQTVLYKPIYNLVVFFYNFSPGPNLGFAIIGVAIFIRFIFLYFTLLGYKHELQLAEIKPQIEKIESDKAFSAKEKINRIVQLTKPYGINPVIASIPLFAQLIFLGVLYQIIQYGLHVDSSKLYAFVKAPEDINTLFFGVDLKKTNFTFSVAAAFILFLERVWEYNEKKSIGKSLSQKWDPLIWPLASFIILIILPSIKALFVVISVLFSMIIKALVLINKPGVK